MTVVLRPMTPEEFIPYEAADARQFAENMVRAGFWSSEGAVARAKESHASLLPGGVHTKDHLFFVIETIPDEAAVGVIWLFIDRSNKPPTGFIYDLLIYEPYRGKGLGKQAMLALEGKARQLGLSSLTLNVFADNTVASSLYASLGYQVKSLNMSKRVPPGS